MLNLARTEHQTNSRWLHRWFERTYKIPASDPLFASRSEAEWQVEIYTDLLRERDGLYEDIEAAQKPSSNISGRQLNLMVERINTIHDLFGEDPVVLDPVIDQWERDLAEGREPDMTRR